MNVLITGGAGYIGSALVKKLLQDKNIDKIIVYDNLSRENMPFFFYKDFQNTEKINFIKGDILDSEKLTMVLENNIDVVYHLAALVSTPFNDNFLQSYDQINNWGTANLVQALEKQNFKGTFIYLSSTSVYGFNNQIINTETLPAPSSMYGISKLKGEQHAMRLKNKATVQIVRSSNVYGFSPTMRLDGAINNIVFNAIHNQSISVNGDGNQIRPYVYIDSLIHFLCDIGFKKIESKTHVASETNISLLGIIGAVKNSIPGAEYLFNSLHMPTSNLEIEPLTSVLKEFNDKEFQQNINSCIASYTI